jgi:transposase-like protein
MHRRLLIPVSNNILSSDVNNLICERVGCNLRANIEVKVMVGSKGRISLFLCKNCSARFNVDSKT